MENNVGADFMIRRKFHISILFKDVINNLSENDRYEKENVCVA